MIVTALVVLPSLSVAPAATVGPMGGAAKINSLLAPVLVLGGLGGFPSTFLIRTTAERGRKDQRACGDPSMQLFLYGTEGVITAELSALPGIESNSKSC
jgi:hypothetical protein